MKILILLFLVLNIGCNLESGPEKALRSFINYSVSQDQNKEFYLENTSGKLLDFYEKLNDEEFKKVLDANIKKVKKVKINLRKCSQSKCSITYTLNYISGEKGENEVLAEVRKIAELTNVDGSWKVSDVLNVKTYYDSKTPLEP